MNDVRKWIATDNLESCVLNTGNLCESLVFEEPRPVMDSLIRLFRFVHTDIFDLLERNPDPKGLSRYPFQVTATL